MCYVRMCHWVGGGRARERERAPYSNWFCFCSLCRLESGGSGAGAPPALSGWSGVIYVWCFVFRGLCEWMGWEPSLVLQCCGLGR